MSEIVQGSSEWHQMRLGKVTASRVADVLAKVKSGEASVRKQYKQDLTTERLTGVKTDFFVNAAMQWGTETEPLARAAYEARTGNFVDQVAFIDHPTIKMFGCSPDGLVGDDGLIEIKCPNSNTHLGYIEDDRVPSRYYAQIMAQLACTGRKWCDFVSFDPRVPDGLQLFITRVNTDDKFILAMEDEVSAFLQEVEAKVNFLKEKSNG